MTERTTLEIIAPTVEEALAQGLAQLGLPADAVSVEVLDSGSKGLFGLGGRQVRVRLTVHNPGEETAQPVAVSAREKAPAAPSRGKRESRPPRPLPAPEQPKAAVEAPAPMPEVAHGLNDPVLDRTEAVISKLLYLMGLQAQVSAHYGESRDDRRPIMVDIRGSDLGILIGRRGETLDAFQYIASLMVGKDVGQFIHLIVDVEGHRDRRQRQLQQLARRMAEQVIKTGRKLTLEPMTASERRIIHMELRDHPAVTTQSSGEEPHRKVTILPKE
ncbi:MAG TPA: RNA-binding cell elongation regulator Jag/EloR [Anaerolineales bacterium]|nr:RNA-binding cell elongation regulator Jag/EloR [Anaerolineales bacterium]